MGRVLILGSSVAEGGSASPGLGWAQQLAVAAAARGTQVDNKAVGGSHVAAWSKRLKATKRDAAEYDVVVMALSLANEGFAHCSREKEREELVQHYLAGLRGICATLRSRMAPTARLVLGGPYANNGYSPAHFKHLLAVLGELRKWEEVDFVIDFLQPVAHDGAGKWPPGQARDPGHPNAAGHASMFACVDVDAVLGTSTPTEAGSEPAPTEPTRRRWGGYNRK